jgi:toxin ParE1/3/4
VQVIWLPRAEVNLLHIVERIARDNVDAAVALARVIRARAEQLSEPPTLFRKGRVRGTREMVVHPNYFVVYRMRPRAKRVEILRVLHAARQWPPSS